LEIKSGFVAGVNTLEVVIENRGWSPGGMKLCVDWHGTARRTAADGEIEK
jgi:hypothetical protein